MPPEKLIDLVLANTELSFDGQDKRYPFDVNEAL
jgi:hypothetical protein